MHVLGTVESKTIVAAYLLNYFVNEKNKNCMFIVDRINLLQQTIDKFKTLKDKCSIIKAGTKFKDLLDLNKPLQITMLQSFYARKEQYKDFKPQYIIVDEFHSGHGTARIKALYEMYPEAQIIGLSATPICSKGNLLKGIDAFIESATVKQLQNTINPINGLPFLANDDNHYIPELYKFYDNIKTTRGDFDKEELSKELDKSFLISNIVDAWEKKAKYLKTLVFALNIKQAENINNEFRARGYKSAVIHSGMKQHIIEDLLRYHKEGRIDILINVAILIAGHDDPTLQCIILEYGTQLLRKFIQMMGRLGRVCEGKTSFITLDFGSNGIRHGRWSDDRFYTKEDDTNKQKFEPYYCPNCTYLVTESKTECPICHYKLSETKEYKAREKKEKEQIEIDRMVLLKQEEYGRAATIQKIAEYFKFRDFSGNAEIIYNGGFYNLKPSNWTDDKFNKLVQMSVKGIQGNNKFLLQNIVAKIKSKLT